MRKRRFKTSSELDAAWQTYKRYCDEYTVVKRMTEDGRERRIEQSCPLTYTVEGFCSYIGMSRQSFYKTYFGNPKYIPTCELIREECEVDARRKFETGQLPSRLAGLWMARYGYCRQTERTDTETEIPKFEDV